MQLLRLLHRPLPKTHQQSPPRPHRSPHVNNKKLADKRHETSTTIHAHIQLTRERQPQRFTSTKLTCNAEMAHPKVRDFSTTSCMKSPPLSVPLNDGSI